MYGQLFMHDFIKYYSYNQLIEDFDILVMSEKEYIANKDQLDNPQKIILVNREGGPKPPKIPLWFKSYKEQTDRRFEAIEKKLGEINNTIPVWFKEFVISINGRLDKIDAKLDKHDQMLKAHGWMK